jgi:hypothetical protein
MLGGRNSIKERLGGPKVIGRKSFGIQQTLQRFAERLVVINNVEVR